MTLVVPTNSKITLLQIINGQKISEDMQLHLYANDVIPNSSTTIHDLQAPAAPEYSPQDLFSVGWTYVTSEPVAMEYPAQTFIFTTTGDTIYGFYVTDNSSGKLLWVEDITPFNIETSGDSIIITARLEIL